MSKAEILAQLPKLNAQERNEVLHRLCELQENDLITGVGPANAEKALLDQALADYERNPDEGTLWSKALTRIRSKL